MYIGREFEKMDPYKIDEWDDDISLWPQVEYVCIWSYTHMENILKRASRLTRVLRHTIIIIGVFNWKLYKFK